jgi:pfkB family carbohydrate kinase/Nucleoside 2-deoxyribosyltransferase
MQIVGGSYDEVCVDPSSQVLLGSGLRAAILCRSIVSLFVTSVAESEREVLDAVSQFPHRDVLNVSTRPYSIRFLYETPISKPLFDSPVLRVVLPTVQNDHVLAFGMVESKAEIKAKHTVIDPQSSLSAKEIRMNVDAEELVLVANSAEIGSMALNQGSDLLTSMRLILDELGASVVVAKCGAVGSIGISKDGAEYFVPATATKTVSPIGSGDAFSAGFASEWFRTGDLQASLRSGSSMAASVCATGQLGPTAELSSIIDLAQVNVNDVSNPPRVYIAASFATIHQRWLLRQVIRKMRDIGIHPFSPLDENGAYSGDASQIAAKDFEGLETCDAVLILADGARTGPWVESGWAAKLGIPAVLFTEEPTKDRYVMLVGSGCHVVSDLASAIYRVGWRALEHRHRR